MQFKTELDNSGPSQLTLFIKNKKLEFTCSTQAENETLSSLYQTSINSPVIISWPNAMKFIEADQIQKIWYPKFASKRFLMKPKGLGFEVLDYANKNWKQIDILHLRIDLLGYVRSFSKHPREIWNRGERLDHIVKIILEHSLEMHKKRQGTNSKSDKPFLAEYEIIENLKINFMKQKKEMKILCLDKQTQSSGFIISTDKKVLKEAMHSLMMQMRLLCRARNLDEIWGIATNLYEWQVIRYSRVCELQKQDNFFQLSHIFKVYDKNKQYSYSDLDMKFIMGLFQSLIKFINE